MNSARRAAAAWACWRWAWRSRAIETDSRPICAISKATCAASDRPGRWPRWAIRSAAARSAEPPAEPVTSRPRRSRAGGRSPSRLRQRVAGVALDQPARPGQHLRRRRCVPRLPRLPRPAARRRRRPAAEPGAGRHWWAAYPRPGRTRPASPPRWRATPPPPRNHPARSPRSCCVTVLAQLTAGAFGTGLPYTATSILVAVILGLPTCVGSAPRGRAAARCGPDGPAALPPGLVRGWSGRWSGCTVGSLRACCVGQG